MDHRRRSRKPYGPFCHSDAVFRSWGKFWSGLRGFGNDGRVFLRLRLRAWQAICREIDSKFLFDMRRARAESGLRAVEQDAGGSLAEEELEALRGPLRSFLFAVLGHPEGSDELVQETLLFLWEHRHERRPDSHLQAWAFKVARFKALSWRRDRARRHGVYFSDDTLVEVAAEAEAMAMEWDPRLEALRFCVERLPADDQALLRRKYEDRASLAADARGMRISENRIHKRLSRLRQGLKRCIESRMRAEAG